MRIQCVSSAYKVLPSGELTLPWLQQEPPVVSAVDSGRLAQIEKSLGLLWDKVTASGGEQEERHTEVLGLCSSLKEELRTNMDKEAMGQWVGMLLEQKLSLLKEEMEKEDGHSQKVRL